MFFLQVLQHGSAKSAKQKTTLQILAEISGVDAPDGFVKKRKRAKKKSELSMRCNVLFNIVVSSLLGLSLLSAHTCNNSVQTIPKEDREVLSAFFETLIRLEPFGYTIFGDKPISEACYSTKLKVRNFISPIEIIYWRGEQLWQKYSSHLNIKNFLFKFQHTENECAIYLINKKSFLKTVEKHIDTFKKILGHDLTSEGLYLKLIDSKNSFGEVLKNDQCLIGILFGYGYKNSAIFKTRHESLLEYEYVTKNIQSSHNDSSETLSLFSEVGFLADKNEPETKTILENYHQTKPLIRDALTGNILEAVICKMAEE